MFFAKVPLSYFASAALFACAEASYLNNDLSFGHNGKLSTDSKTVPNFHLIGNPNLPEILSNKVVLTPVAPGGQRGAIWADMPLAHSEWTVDVDFRATGPERGGGNLQLWYVKDGEQTVGTKSIYTVGKFDGLALVIDQYQSSGGFIRGFLNDGKTDYSNHYGVDSLAFGHCQYSFRNLGRPSRIAVRHSNDNFRVDVDGQLCFDSTKIKLPLGYTFGISAASAETPDTFEVFKFVTTTENYSPDLQEPIQQDARVAYSQGQYKQAINEEQPPNSGLFDDIPEVPAADIRSTEAQFADLHNRLQAMMKNLNAANRDVAIFQRSTRDDLTKLAVQLSRIEGVLSKFDSVDKKLDDVNSDVRQTKKDLHQALEKQVAGLKHVVKDTHSTILGTLAASAPSLLMYAVMVFGSNAVLIVAYLIYKQRKANSPKKYL